MLLRCLLAVALLPLAACDSMMSDFDMLGKSFSPPTPQEAAAWAVDPSDPEAQRRGLVLLGTATFGGEPTYIELYRIYVTESRDPLVKAAAIESLCRFAQPTEAKLIALQEITARLGITPGEAIAVGDGANDLPMLRAAGTGVAMHAKPRVQAECEVRVNHGDLTALLYLQGYARDEFVDPEGAL